MLCYVIVYGLRKASLVHYSFYGTYQRQAAAREIIVSNEAFLKL